ncbi:MAG: tetratricopeptide repeat protein [Proteobacteria bacterium]|nr:tetratricopeptide repeat protein [Pseudomonadota bacterium]
MKKAILPILIFILSACAGSSDRVQTEYFKDFQSQLVALSQRVEALEVKAKRDTNIKLEVTERLDKIDEKIGSLEKNLERIKTNPLLEVTESAKLTPVPASSVISIKPEGVIKVSETAEKQATPEVKKDEAKTETPKKEEKPLEVKEVTQKETSQTLYNKGYEMYSQGKYPQTISIFREFLQKYPKDALADNAQYWIAESYYSQKNFQKAIEEFKKVEKYPDGNKAPDAYYKIYLAYTELGNKKEAEKWKKELLKKYKDSEPAKKIK